MSWRLIFVMIVLAAGASAWGGLRLGDWLIAHGPTQAKVQAPHPELELTQVLGANGQPFVATAPQPLPDGSQGTPALRPPVDWHIQTQSLMDGPARIALATTTITLDEAIALATQNQAGDALQGIGTLDGASLPIQPIDIPPVVPATSTPATPGVDANWKKAFHAELKVCEDVGFFSRPSCAWAARNKYCEPHQAWGKVEGCPAKRSAY